MKKKPLTREEIERQAVRGIICNCKECPLKEIGASLKEALEPTNEILRSITRAVEGPGEQKKVFSIP